MNKSLHSEIIKLLQTRVDENDCCLKQFNYAKDLLRKVLINETIKNN